MVASELHARRPLAVRLFYGITAVLVVTFLAALVLPRSPRVAIRRPGIPGDAGAAAPAASSGARGPPAAAAGSPPAGGGGANASSIDVHLGNGCFWERQWAYYVVETDPDGPFRRAPGDATALAGYAGGDDPASDAEVCYHTGDDRDYAARGYAETVRVTLDAGAAEEQLRALARDYFGSFTGPAGERTRPDPGDVGPPYRSVFGLPGGKSSPLYAAFEGENAHGMDLRDGAPCEGRSCGSPHENVVYVYDTDVSPFRRAEVYHQFHCDFSYSSGMPYPASYWRDLYEQMKDAGRIAPTGCPESGVHPGRLCST